MTSFDMCPICLEDMYDANTRVFLICKHWFHQKCIEKWWIKSPPIHCPYCKKSSECSEKDDLIDLCAKLDYLIVKRVYCHGSATLDQIINWILICKEYKVIYMYASQLNELVPQRIISLTEKGYLKKEADVYVYIK
jgi:hypothetical protein